MSDILTIEGLDFWKIFFSLSYKEKIDSEIFTYAKLRSEKWTHCAACELKQERIKNGRPLNSKLEDLGIQFSQSIKLNRFDEAQEAFSKIQIIVAKENKL